MGIMSNKVTRRVALGSIAGGLAAGGLVLRALRSKYHINLPDGASARTVGGKTPITYLGQNITVDVPHMQIRGPEDEKKYLSIVAEQARKNPKIVQAERVRFEKSKQEYMDSRIAIIDAEERQLLEQVAKADVGEQDKKALTEYIRERIRARKKLLAERIARTTLN
jgi:hypothetical protein